LRYDAPQSALGEAIRVGDYDIEPGWIVQRGAFRATVLIRGRRPAGPVQEVSYVFAEEFDTDTSALLAAHRFALIASLHPDRHLARADNEFAVQ
jgi:hypothetical protein